MADGRTPDISPDDIKRSSRDRAELHDAVETWLRRRHVGAVVSEVTTPSNGMSSETILFDASWPDDVSPQGTAGGGFVLRLEPTPDAVPVFPSYDLDGQRRAIELVAEHTAAPVPKVRWYEPDSGILGSPFFVMERIDGWVPPDVLPYTMESRVLEMDPGARRRLQDATVDVLAEIHTAPTGVATRFLGAHPGEGTALRRHVERWRSYHRWVCGERSIPVLDEAHRWLEANWPADAAARPAVLSWGDARIGNVIYDDRDVPVAVLDWEMAAVAPREVDLGWMSFLHTFFQDLTEELGLPGLPDMLRLDDVVARYGATSGVEPVDVDWFEVYAAYRHGVIMARIHDRQVRFGEAEPVVDPDEAVMHRARLRRLIER